MLHNPGLINTARGFGVDVQRYRSSGTLGTVSAAIALGSGGLAVGVQVLLFGMPGATVVGVPFDARALLQPGPLAASEIVGTLGYGRVIKGFRLGVAAQNLGPGLSTGTDGPDVPPAPPCHISGIDIHPARRTAGSARNRRRLPAPGWRVHSRRGHRDILVAHHRSHIHGENRAEARARRRHQSGLLSGRRLRATTLPSSTRWNSSTALGPFGLNPQYEVRSLACRPKLISFEASTDSVSMETESLNSDRRLSLPLP